MKLGRIPWINCHPVYGAFDRSIVPLDAELVPGTASELNDLLAAGHLDLSVVSAVEYARGSAGYHLLPSLAISCDGPVHSVLLLSRRPPAELDGATVLVSASSRTSVLLLELLCRRRWRVEPRFVTTPLEPPDLPRLAAVPHEGVLVIGDAALVLQQSAAYRWVTDLGTEWKAWTDLPFVFAVWAARREAPLDRVRHVHGQLLESRSWGLAHLDELATQAAGQTGLDRDACRAYLANIDYALGERHLAGLTTFFRRLARERLAPEASLSFLPAA